MTPLHPPGNSNLASYNALNFWAFEIPHPPQNFQSLLLGVWIFSGTTQSRMRISYELVVKKRSQDIKIILNLISCQEKDKFFGYNKKYFGQVLVTM